MSGLWIDLSPGMVWPQEADIDLNNSSGASSTLTDTPPEEIPEAKPLMGFTR